MSGIYHPRGFWRGLLRPPAWQVREWLRNPAFRALHRFHAQLRGLPRATPACVRFGGRSIELCDGPSFLSAWDEIFVNRIYEISVPPGEVPTLVDAGANIGLAALFWKQCYGRFNYLGFEPDPVVAACCHANLKAWEIGGQLIEAAVGAVDGSSEFISDGADGGRLTAEAATGTAVARRVDVRRLSRLLPARVDLLKIDVEGAEGEVLADVAEHLGRVRALFVEWHSRRGQAGLGTAIERLEGAGFDCYMQVASGPERPLKFVPATDGFSQHINLYAVRP
jgi:FkbM family methyltransferase